MDIFRVVVFEPPGCKREPCEAAIWSPPGQPGSHQRDRRFPLTTTPALVATVAALSWLVPWLGTIIALTALAVVELPALVLKWPGSLLSVAAAASFTVLVFVILESGVEPRLFNRRRYNSLFIVLAVIALAKTFGILGSLLGPMAAVTIQAALEHAEASESAARPSGLRPGGPRCPHGGAAGRPRRQQRVSARMDQHCRPVGGLDRTGPRGGRRIRRGCRANSRMGAEGGG